MLVALAALVSCIITVFVLGSRHRMVTHSIVWQRSCSALVLFPTAWWALTALGCHSAASSRADLGMDLAAPCVANEPCELSTAAPCHEGQLLCTGGGATCADVASPDGTACNGGLCTLGACRAPLEIAADVDLSMATVTPGRACAAEAPAYAVTALESKRATLTTAPTLDCLASGDEVLLVDLQGAAGLVTNVGNWELLRVATVTGSSVDFSTDKAKYYGASANSDTGVGAGAADQKVVLIRVPQFGALTIDAGVTVSTGGWDGQTGGVLALRAAQLLLHGTVSVAGRGYRSGRWSLDDGNCADSVATESGESIDGVATQGTMSHAGAPGGLGAATAQSFAGMTPINAGAGHGTSGQAGLPSGARIVGTPGNLYGVPDASQLTMGSGSSGNLTCQSGPAAAPVLTVREPALAGGIALLLTATLEVIDAGAVRADAVAASRDVSASGGYVFIRGNTLTLGDAHVSALGGTATNPQRVGASVKSSDGYVVLQAPTITGVTTPPARAL